MWRCDAVIEDQTVTCIHVYLYTFVFNVFRSRKKIKIVLGWETESARLSETEVTQERWNFLLTLHTDCHNWRYMKYSLICIQICILCIICASRADQIISIWFVILWTCDIPHYFKSIYTEKNVMLNLLNFITSRGCTK